MINYLQECLMTDIVMKRPLTLEEKDVEEFVKEEELFIHQILANLELIEAKFKEHKTSNVVPMKTLIKFHQFSTSIRLQLGLRLSRMGGSKHSRISTFIMQGGCLQAVYLAEQPRAAVLNKQSDNKLTRVQKVKLFWRKQINRVLKRKQKRI